LGLEGAHSKNRIVHSGGDATGKQVMNFLSYSLQKNIVIKENRLAYELLIDHQANRCYGVKVKRTDGGIETHMANHIVLATGGCGQLYSYTSNAASVCGDGIALAYQAGARLADMEFMQFHPTLLY
ncbi:FAD-binding protein, partial [Escherichia coli]